ncbi:MAG: histidine kinase [Bacteroidia bacterium]
MKYTRLYQHILFWLCYYSVSLFNELYISEEFSIHPSLEMFLQSAFSVLLLLVIKIIAVYYVLYFLIPNWISPGNKTFVILKTIGILLSAAIVCRLIVHQLVWPYIYQIPNPHLAPARITARFFNTLLDILQVCGAAVAIKLFKLRMNALKKEKILVQEKLQSEMMHLKAQVNPHFLFNSLNSIYSLSRSQSALTPEAVMQLSKILRYVLYDAENKRTFIKDEIKIAEDYIELQQLRFNQRITITFKKNIDENNALVIPLLLLPLIENAYKHGNALKSLIYINMNLLQGKLNIQVKNSLGGQSVEEPRQGIGLKNIQRQLELQYQSFNFTHEKQNEFFIVDLYIDLNSYTGDELFDHRR